MSRASKGFEEAYKSRFGPKESTNGADITAITTITADSKELPGAEQFPVNSMPVPCRVLINEAAAAIGCPPEFVAVPMLVVLGSAIGNSRVLKLKGGWEEGATIYAAAIADPGEKKTPAYKVAVDPALKKQAELRNLYREELEEYKRELREYEVDKKAAAKVGETAPPEPEPPTMDRTLVEDTTIEALAKVLEASPRGVAGARDELAGWVRAMDQYKQGGKGSDRQFWLSGWSNSPVIVDRKGAEEPTVLQRPFVGVFGSIQPGVLPELGQGREDGLLDRFLVAYPEPTPSRWTDDEITEGAMGSYRKLYNRLRDLHMPEDEYGDPNPTRIHFSPDAKAVLIEAINSHREEMEQPGFPSRLKGPWAKMEAYIARLCLILALSRSAHEGVAERVEERDVLAATVLADYFKNHARRAYIGLYGENPDDRLTENVVEFLKAQGGSWEGQPAELHEQLKSSYKPSRPDELSKKLKAIAARTPNLTFEGKDKWVKELGNKRRFISLTLKNGGNGGNGGNGEGGSA